MFEVSEEHQKSLNEIKEILVTQKKKICNLISDPIEEQRKAQVIPPEIQKVFDKYLKIISKGDQDIGNYNLIEYEIHFKHDRLIKSLV